MKKILFISTLLASALFSSCDHEQFYPGLEEAAVQTNKLVVSYNLADADYAAIATANIKKLDKKSATYKTDSTTLAKISSGKVFADQVQARTNIPALLSSKWNSATEGTAIKIGYKRTDSALKSVNATADPYTISNADYAKLWNRNDVTAFTPKVSAIDNIPNILLTVYPSASKSNYVLVNYNEATSEPATGKSLTGSSTSSIFVFDGAKWSLYTSNVKQFIITDADYAIMGHTYTNFTNFQQDIYVPIFLKQKAPYAQENEIKSVVYKSKEGPFNTDVYKMVSGNWVKLNASVDQFVFSNGVWKYNPSIVVDLKPNKQAETTAFYQAIVDYVGKTFGVGYYQTGSTTVEFYYGASARNNNISFKVNDWRGCKEGATAYASFNDDELTKLMNKRIPEAFIPALEKRYSDAAPADGVDVTCTVNFGIYTGTPIADCTHTIVYKVISKGKFEYVKDSFKEIKK